MKHAKPVTIGDLEKLLKANFPQIVMPDSGGQETIFQEEKADKKCPAYSTNNFIRNEKRMDPAGPFFFFGLRRSLTFIRGFGQTARYSPN
ncbi:hypothetical protein J31TS4_14230 [Paenibacillus sp. J31TS4]|uniref:hypothetical protein n=1 Tax=Paenibacillus sp. J31TS4 TaxID=2807195 RepID=UPI001B2E678D|nr:hypothetical protein [Paenibacillus sp. J31TS4]GIP38143.1 hypothetical protein J31TS4_14230 [Paenibacillus sp. J31TS4]